jgi:acetyl esterase/lipase
MPSPAPVREPDPRRVVLVLPGGGYSTHAAHEAEPIAAWLEGLGWTARVVRYPLSTPHPAPLDAVRREIAAARRAGARAVGLIGFSAGGHLAALAAAAAGSAEERPDFAVLGYPVVSMIARPHVRSRAILVGESEQDAAAVSVERLVTPQTPPVFVWHTVGDAVVPVQHTYLLGRALADAGVEHEVHTFPGDVHGVALAEGTDAAVWTRLCARWLALR